ncbi:MAG: P-loop NTPase, partial [Coriobacteriales bacterium]
SPGLDVEKGGMSGSLLIPSETRTGIKAISVNCMLSDQTDPVLWEGNVLVATLKRFWEGVSWKGIDYLFIDMPPGTGDIAMTVFKTLPVDGTIIVASPQKLVGVMVEKCIKMVEKFQVPILGIVQNMSYFECPHCGERTYIFGTYGVDDMAERYGIDQVAYLPFNTDISSQSDAGDIEDADVSGLDGIVEHLLEDFPPE